MNTFKISCLLADRVYTDRNGTVHGRFVLNEAARRWFEDNGYEYAARECKEIIDRRSDRYLIWMELDIPDDSVAVMFKLKFGEFIVY